MPERGSEPLARKHVWMSKDDWDWIESTFGASLGTSAAIRLMIKKFRTHVEAKAADVAKRPAGVAETVDLS